MEVPTVSEYAARQREAKREHEARVFAAKYERFFPPPEVTRKAFLNANLSALEPMAVHGVALKPLVVKPGRRKTIEPIYNGPPASNYERIAR